MSNARHGYKPKWTPPQWIVNWTYDKGGKSSKVVPYSGGSKLHEPICIIPHDDITEEGEAEMLANAALIIAAGDLYKALVACVEDMEGHGIINPSHPAYAALEQVKQPRADGESHG